MVDLILTPLELIRCAHVAELHQKTKQARVDAGQLQNRRFSDLDDFEAHYIGLLGEAAVSRILGVRMREDVTVAGDGAVDLVVRGQTIQVKTRKIDHAAMLLPFNSLRDFSADWAVCCALASPCHVRVYGFISREAFAQVHHTRDFGYGPRCVVPASTLEPVEDMRSAILALQAQRKSAADLERPLPDFGELTQC